VRDEVRRDGRHGDDLRGGRWLQVDGGYLDGGRHTSGHLRTIRISNNPVRQQFRYYTVWVSSADTVGQQ
jgi:hypothetical protein